MRRHALRSGRVLFAPMGLARAGATTQRRSYEGPAIPDSAITHLDWSQEDGSLPITDQTGNGNHLDEGSYSGVSATINGVQAGEFDGAGDMVKGAFSVSANPSRIYAVVAIQTTSPSGDQHLFNRYDSPDSQTVLIAGGGGSGGIGSSEYGMYAGNAGSFNQSLSSEGVVLTWDVDGANSTLRVNQTETTIDSDPGSEALNGISVGGRGDGDYHTHVNVGEIIVDPDPTDGPETYEQNLAGKWGITL